MQAIAISNFSDPSGYQECKPRNVLIAEQGNAWLTGLLAGKKPAWSKRQYCIEGYKEALLAMKEWLDRSSVSIVKAERLNTSSFNSVNNGKDAYSRERLSTQICKEIKELDIPQDTLHRSRYNLYCMVMYHTSTVPVHLRWCIMPGGCAIIDVQTKADVAEETFTTPGRASRRVFEHWNYGPTRDPA